jgi:hypothetical protein
MNIRCDVASEFYTIQKNPSHPFAASHDPFHTESAITMQLQTDDWLELLQESLHVVSKTYTIHQMGECLVWIPKTV